MMSTMGIETKAAELFATMPEVSTGHVGVLLFGVGGAWGAAYLEKRWWPVWKDKWAARQFAKGEALRKAKRTKEAMDIREVRLLDAMTELVGDGLLTLYTEGKISGQEYRKLSKEFGEKMNLPDLLNAKQRLEKTKETIRERIANDVHSRDTITVDKCGRRHVTVKIPGPKPGEPTSTVGKPVSKYWRAKTVSA